MGPQWHVQVQRGEVWSLVHIWQQLVHIYVSALLCVLCYSLVPFLWHIFQHIYKLDVYLKKSSNKAELLLTDLCLFSSVPLERDNSEEFLKREARAAQLAEEIEASATYKARVALENDERSEEEKYTAVVRGERETHTLSRWD